MKLMCAWLATALAFSTSITASIAGPTAVLSSTQYSAHPWKKQADWMKPHRKHKKEKNSEGQTAAQENVQEQIAGKERADSITADASAKAADKDVTQTQPGDTKQISKTNSQVSK